MDALLLALLVPGLLFFIITTLILVHNHRHFPGLAAMVGDNGFDGPDSSCDPDTRQLQPLVSVLVPARNEEGNLPKLLESLQQQDWPRLEVHILDDQSEDRTGIIAETFREQIEFRKKTNSVHGAGPHSTDDWEVFVHSSAEKPQGWLGKNWACHQLAKYARGDVFIFLDADTWLSPDTISSIVAGLNRYNLDFATVWPHQVMETIPEKAVVATVYATVAIYLPTRYSYRAPLWIPNQTLREKVKPLFASACGQCMIFTRETYLATGGHESVKNQVVEDVMLAKNVVKTGRTMRMFHGTGRLWCRMYDNPSELFQGFRKNFFAGFSYRYLPFLAAWLLHFAAFVLPVLVLVSAGVMALHTTPDAGIVIGISATMVAVAILQRIWVAKFLEWPLSTAFLYLPGILWFHALAFVVLRDHLSDSRPTWKGRSI